MRGVGIAARELAGDAGEPGAEANASTRPRPTTAACRKRTSARAYGSIEPLTSHSSTIRRGRVAGSTNERADRLAAGAQRAAHGAAQVGPATLAPARLHGDASGAARREAEVGHQPAGLGELVGRVRGEVALAQHLGRLKRTASVGTSRRRRRPASGSSSSPPVVERELRPRGAGGGAMPRSMTRVPPTRAKPRS